MSTKANDDGFLLIEDDLSTAQAMIRLMETVGIAVEHVGTVREGLAALVRMPAVVVLDLMLPDGCGVEVLEAIRSTNLRCKVAVISSSTNPEVFQRLQATRPDAIFPKPFDFQDFVEWLCEAFPEQAPQNKAA